MSSGFKVDYDQLSELASVLFALKDEFEGLEDNIGPYKDAAGHDGVADKLDGFATNWSDDRGEITEAMQQVAEYGQQSADAYRGTDEELGAQYADSGQ